jgi:3-oxoacyl-[acyl-carrier protein] reductase
VRQIRDLPNRPNIFTVTGDISKVEDPELIIGACKAWRSRPGSELTIDILVNNAGVEVVKGLGSITTEAYNKVYDLNVRGTILMTQAVLPYLPPCGRIINISSVGSRAWFKDLSLYCFSKAAIEGLTRCWAAELGHNGTTVNAVNPGPVESEMLANIPKDIVEGRKKATPIENRLGTVEEVAAVVGWLAGNESRWVTGQTISASGGWAMYWVMGSIQANRLEHPSGLDE